MVESSIPLENISLAICATNNATLPTLIKKVFAFSAFSWVLFVSLMDCPDAKHTSPGSNEHSHSCHDGKGN
jgi:hypothetical protein